MSSVTPGRLTVLEGAKLTVANAGKVYLTITADGRLVPGPGLSTDEATQKAAQMLAEHFKKYMQS